MLTARLICHRTIKTLLLAQHLKNDIFFGRYGNYGGQMRLYRDVLEWVGGLGLLTLMLGTPSSEVRGFQVRMRQVKSATELGRNFLQNFFVYSLVP